MKLVAAWQFLRAYRRAKALDWIQDRASIEAWQQRWLQRLKKAVTTRAPYYHALAETPFEDWPVIGKSEWMANFDEMNTVGAKLRDLHAFAAHAEETRDFSKNWRGLTVGLSTGTSGSRGMYVVSPRERSQWAGTLLGKLLHGGLLSRERIALVLRAGSPLYDRVGTLGLQFRFYDQARPWENIQSGLKEFDPTILVAPARVLALIARTTAGLRPRRVISVAEVLDDLDRAQIQTGFGVPVEQIYQATEGFLGVSCEHGAVHLMEPYVLIEREWLDSTRSRFVPVVTDLWREAQPVIRYRMNDILRLLPGPCPCGRASTAVAAIDGRLDDILWLDGLRGPVAVFPDLVTRAIVTAAPALIDYQVQEVRRGQWQIQLRPDGQAECHALIAAAVAELVGRLGAAAPELAFSGFPEQSLRGKQRRVLSNRGTSCAS